MYLSKTPGSISYAMSAGSKQLVIELELTRRRNRLLVSGFGGTVVNMDSSLPDQRTREW